MPEITAQLVKDLRERTGAGIMDCKRALETSKGDFQKAQEILRQQGLAIAAQKASRTAKEGLIEAYIHSGSRVGALIEVNCETDFVARTPDFRQLAHDLAMQVAAMNPTYTSREELPSDSLNPEEVCLLQQPFIKDPTRTVQDIVNEVIARVGENIKVRRFTRFALNE